MSSLDQARATQLRNIETKTGKSLQELRTLLTGSGLAKHGELRSFAMEKLGRTADSLDRIVSGNEATLAQFAGSGVGDLQQLIIDLQGTSEEVRALARSLRENPSGLLIERKESGMEIPP